MLYQFSEEICKWCNNLGNGLHNEYGKRQRSEMHETIRHPHVLSGQVEKFMRLRYLNMWTRKLFARILFEVNIMKKILLSMLIAFFLVSFLCSQAYSEKESLDLSIDEALILLKDLDPNVKVIAVKAGPVEGLWEVDIESGGKKLAVYVDNSKKYLISGSIIDMKAKRNLTQERLDEINKIDVSQIPLDDALVMGDKEAKYRVIVFDDPE
jgi:hypothetical protein